MIKGNPFSLSSANGLYTLQASSVGLPTFAACVVENAGPGACGIYPSGTPAGPPLEVVGAYQRKYVMLGNVDTIALALIKPASTSILGANVYQNNLYATLAVCDDYSLAGTPDYRRGAFASITWTLSAFPQTLALLQATDMGFDRIRGIYIPPQASPPEVFIPSNGGFFIPLLSESGTSLSAALAVVAVTIVNGQTLMLSDEQINAGGAGGGTYG